MKGMPRTSALCRASTKKARRSSASSWIWMRCRARFFHEAVVMSVPELKRSIGFRDLVLFNVSAVLSLRWIATAAKTGPHALTLWVLAMVMFFIPQSLTVVALTERFPEEGGIYDWTKRAFGPFHGFFCGWCYWVSNLSFFPALLIAGVGAGV